MLSDTSSFARLDFTSDYPTLEAAVSSVRWEGLMKRGVISDEDSREKPNPPQPYTSPYQRGGKGG